MEILSNGLREESNLLKLGVSCPNAEYSHTVVFVIRHFSNLNRNSACAKVGDCVFQFSHSDHQFLMGFHVLAVARSSC